MVYEEWYKVAHTEPELLEEAVYGLPEWDRDAIKDATVIANPGCFVTSILLGLMPLMKKVGSCRTASSAIVKSGTSGAGRAGNVANLFTEVESSFKAYGVAHHRHTPEIEQLLTQMAGTDIFIEFTPHLVPISRGILSTIMRRSPGDIRQKKSTLFLRKLTPTNRLCRFCLRACG